MDCANRSDGHWQVRRRERTVSATTEESNRRLLRARDTIHHIGMNFFASPDKPVDPKKKLEGAGKTSRMLRSGAPPTSMARAT